MNGAAPEARVNEVTTGAGPSFGLGTRTGAARQQRLLSLPVFKHQGDHTGSQSHQLANVGDKQWMPFPGSIPPPIVEKSKQTRLNGNPIFLPIVKVSLQRTLGKIHSRELGNWKKKALTSVPEYF